MFKRNLKEELNITWGSIKTAGLWIVLGTLIGGLTGLIGSLFSQAVTWANAFRGEHNILVLFLPIAGLVCVFLYHIAGEDHNRGTNGVIAAVRHEGEITPLTAPLILATTFLTHLFGGSAGREGAALQFGGSLATSIGKLFRLNDDKMKLFIMAGMSGAFSALFGTPLAAIIFSMEVISVGVMYYAALIPCTCASFVAYFVSLALKTRTTLTPFPVLATASFFSLSSLKILIIALICPLVGMIFCVLLKATSRLYQKYLPNPYIRVVVAGLLIFLLASVLHTQDYLGQGAGFIDKCFNESAHWYSFLLKAVFTAITLGAGYKGGEIVPSLFIGAALGSCLAPLLGLPIALCTGCGMVGVFCAVTNCPISSILIAFELFGFSAMPYYVVVIAISYALSGYYSLYSSQKIMYSKTRPKLVNRTMH